MPICGWKAWNFGGERKTDSPAGVTVVVWTVGGVGKDMVVCEKTDRHWNRGLEVQLEELKID